VSSFPFSGSSDKLHDPKNSETMIIRSGMMESRFSYETCRVVLQLTVLSSMEIEVSGQILMSAKRLVNVGTRYQQTQLTSKSSKIEISQKSESNLASAANRSASIHRSASVEQ
jgi:hypothetical protein